MSKHKTIKISRRRMRKVKRSLYEQALADAEYWRRRCKSFESSCKLYRTALDSAQERANKAESELRRER